MDNFVTLLSACILASINFYVITKEHVSGAGAENGAERSLKLDERERSGT